MLAVAYATDMASHARQVKGDDPDKKGCPGPPLLRKSSKGISWIDLMMVDG